MSALRMRHVGLVVRNLETSINFYCSILGLSVYKRYSEPPGEFIDRLTGIKNVSLEWAKLSLPDGGLIELLEYRSHPDPAAGEKPRDFPSNRLGCSHTALTVKDLPALYKKLLENGYRCNSEPLVSPDGKVKILYCHDPDGIILELIENITPIIKINKASTKVGEFPNKYHRPTIRAIRNKIHKITSSILILYPLLKLQQS